MASCNLWKSRTVWQAWVPSGFLHATLVFHLKNYGLLESQSSIFCFYSQHFPLLFYHSKTFYLAILCMIACFIQAELSSRQNGISDGELKRQKETQEEAADEEMVILVIYIFLKSRACSWLWRCFNFIPCCNQNYAEVCKVVKMKSCFIDLWYT